MNSSQSEKDKNGQFEKDLRLGIMGGVFDPIHIGHLFTAEEARIKFNLHKVIFVPSLQPIHKRNDQITDIKHRLKMTYLATEDNPYFEVSKIEINRPGPSYTIDTVREFRKIYGWQTNIFFITGADAFLEIDTWYKKDELIKLCQFVAATRPGYDLDKLNDNFKKVLKIMEIPALAISSTDIRYRVKNNLNIKYIVLEEVRDYIYKNKLYV
ncbi:MAG: nicotinate-nucleotide adenylyltransferase [Candidatus Atribacteria bacterium]|nr:nicotinate-nucleotide adenylyltransferase [Candidatus Atribacteria bacterium]